MSATQRNHALDFLRALAIVMVMNCHIVDSFGQSNPLLFLGLGGVGVDLFFLLSGWLLGKQMCEEFRNRGTIDVPRFWRRRWLRTMPAYYVMLLLTVAQACIQGKLTWDELPFLVFLQNYTGTPFFSISWSLCVEEYFYLAVAPLLLLVLARPRWGAPLAVVVLAIPVVCRVVYRAEGWYYDPRMTHVRYDQCAAGVALAMIAVFAPGLWLWLRRTLVILLPIALAMATANFVGRAFPTLGIRALLTEEWTFVFATFIVWAAAAPGYARIPGSGFVAERAYSLYLVHIEGIALAKRLPDMGLSPDMRLITFTIVVWTVSLALAEVLYRCVELPGMRLRERFASTRSLNRLPAEHANKGLLVPAANVIGG